MTPQTWTIASSSYPAGSYPCSVSGNNLVCPGLTAGAGYVTRTAFGLSPGNYTVGFDFSPSANGVSDTTFSVMNSLGTAATTSLPNGLTTGAWYTYTLSFSVATSTCESWDFAVWSGSHSEFTVGEIHISLTN